MSYPWPDPFARGRQVRGGVSSWPEADNEAALQYAPGGKARHANACANTSQERWDRSTKSAGCIRVRHRPEFRSADLPV